ncbi:MAG: poly(A) polymerase [Acidobacteriota bacterium]
MVDPRVVPRAEHTLSRRDVDPDALKVLYRLRQFDHTSYLVGGSVRDLLIGRRPKDFDIGTSAHPYQVKKLFRNCWIIGRRFRLAHVKFGTKVIEVATFRRQVAAGEEIVQDGVPAPVHHPPPDAAAAVGPATLDPPRGERTADHFIHHDNTFGTPEEDAFRRDFTINALFYDIATFSVIDYVGGLEDLRAGVVRSIGDPEVRFREDPVRMMRAVALAARLDFTIDQPSLDAIDIHRHELARSSPPRLLEEYYKILRAGSAERTFRELTRLGLLEPVSAELHHGAAESLWQSLAALDGYRRQFDSTPDTLTNAILLGSLIGPLGLVGPGRALDSRASSHATPPGERRAGDGSQRDDRTGPGTAAAANRRDRHRPTGPRLGELPLARRDIERLRQILGLQRRLRDVTASPRTRRALTHRSIFREALTWLDIHGAVPEIVEQWRLLLAETDTSEEIAGEEVPPEEIAPRRRRRRRRRRDRPTTP